jgi:Dyp-type peroxidase family
MPINLNAPLDDTVLSNTEKGFLQNLQANIVKGHGREHVALVFLAVNKVTEARHFLHKFAVSDAYSQLLEASAFKKQGIPGGLVQLAFLSQSGLNKFGHAAQFASFPAFSAGMAADTDVLDNGSTASWQPGLKQTCDVLLLLAHHERDTLAQTVAALVEPWGELDPDAAFHTLFIQEGGAFKNARGEGIEHFGYVDGRSQPQMLTSGAAAERSEQAEPKVGQYDPTSPLKQFVLPDPLDANGHGSFFVFRKLEQNVAGFKRHEKALADTLGLEGRAAERAGALAVGRFEDGTPVTLSPTPWGGEVQNNFTYEHDSSGGRCPFHAHIRKTNPRGASPGGLAFDKSVQMARRGITYGHRLQHPVTREFIDKPNDGVGLLFMSYQSSIENQFRFMQTQWVDNPDFPHANVGVDPVLSNKGGPDQNWPTGWDRPTDTQASLFEGFVSLKGGEYFYTPSIGGLKNL